MSEEVSPAVKLRSEQMAVREQNRCMWKKDAGDLIDAHMLAFSSVASMIERFSGKKFETQSKSIEGRMSLTAQFMQGIDVCEVSISEGLYSQAAALLKQELETLAAVDEYENNRRIDGKTPNVKNGTMNSFGPIYGDLNNIAHVSQHDLARLLVAVEMKDISAPSIVPQYNAGLAKFLYGNHVYFIIEISKQTARIFHEIFSQGFSVEEEKWISMAMLILVKEKVVKFPADIKEKFPDINFDKF
jgi:hypothetical protein